MNVVVAIYLICFVSFRVAEDIDELQEHPNWHLLDHEECGNSLTDRIIGGTAASVGQYPWMVQIGYTKIYTYVRKPPFFKCGGSLINNLYVVTAAHCVTELHAERLEILRLGELDTSKNVDCVESVCAPPVQDFKPAKIIYHQKYQNPKMRNDIALIRLDRRARLNTFVAPICLPHGPLLTRNHAGSIMEVAGWGMVDMRVRRTSHILLHVRVPIVNASRCDKTLGKFARMGPGQLCAGGRIGQDSCGGDSGGPLMKPEAIDGPPKFFLIGVVSFGSVKCGSKSPAVYTDVAHYMPWILDNIEP